MAAARMVLLLTLTAVLLLTGGEHPAPVGGEERAPLNQPDAEQHRSQSAMPVPVARGATAGAVEEDKAYIVGRPLFKVPPSSPCRAKALHC
ncbi:unnamed protein product [Urochloa decumbens]|uniref:Uncharacterized protein n=1 Tax=Urochloa decumbens TaxID=240449 RepID=A0ABC9C1J9_9POAL